SSFPVVLNAPHSSLFPCTTLVRSTEQALLDALTWLKETMSSKAYLQLGRRAFSDDARNAAPFAEHLARMGLSQPESVKEKLYRRDRKSTRLNSSHVKISYAVFCLK